MKIKKIFSLVIFLFSLSTAVSTAAIATEPFSCGLVSFSKCITESKYGKQEQESFDQVQAEMNTIFSDLTKQMSTIEGNLNDIEFLDSLSPEAIEELKGKRQMLQDEFMRYDTQARQVLNQAQMRFFQVIRNYATKASTVIAKQKQLLLVLLEENNCLYFHPSGDITALTIKEMDKAFDKEKKTLEQVIEPKNQKK